MPKIIENLGDDIIKGAIKIIERDGLESLSIRKLSSELGIAASTIYNYYESKEAVIGAAAMTVWAETMESISSLCTSDKPEIEILSAIAVKLRTLFRPLYLFHLSAANMNSEEKKHKEHGRNYGKEISLQLKEQIKRLLISRNHDAEEAEECAAVLTSLVFVCVHNEELSFESIASVIKTVS